MLNFIILIRDWLYNSHCTVKIIKIENSLEFGIMLLDE